MTKWLVHVSFISVTEVLVTQWLGHVSSTSVTEVFVTSQKEFSLAFIPVAILAENYLTCGKNSLELRKKLYTAFKNNIHPTVP